MVKLHDEATLTSLYEGKPCRRGLPNEAPCRTQQQARDDIRQKRISFIRVRLRLAESEARFMAKESGFLEDLDLADELRRVRERHLDWAEEAGLEEGAA